MNDGLTRLGDTLGPIPDLRQRIDALAEHARLHPPPPQPPPVALEPTTPAQYRRRLADLEQTREVRSIARWASTWTPASKWLVIAGPVGTGKSTIAGAVATTLGDPVPARYCWVPGWLQALRASMDGTPPKVPVERLLRSSLVVLDDLGAERGTEWEASKIAHVVEGRYDLPGGLIVTTNLNEHDLRQRYGARAVSRLIQRSAWVVLAGGDRRRR